MSVCDNLERPPAGDALVEAELHVDALEDEAGDALVEAMRLGTNACLRANMALSRMAAEVRRLRKDNARLNERVQALKQDELDDDLAPGLREENHRLLDANEDMLSENERLTAHVDELVKVGTGEVKHDYAGGCPDDVNGPDQRDPECEACRILGSAEGER